MINCGTQSNMGGIHLLSNKHTVCDESKLHASAMRSTINPLYNLCAIQLAKTHHITDFLTKRVTANGFFHKQLLTHAFIAMTMHSSYYSDLDTEVETNTKYCVLVGYNYCPALNVWSVYFCLTKRWVEVGELAASRKGTPRKIEISILIQFSPSAHLVHI